MTQLNRNQTGFPLRLQSITDPPATLWYQGNLPRQDATALAVVGTRRPTTYGTSVTQSLVGELGKLGIIIVSGLAYGVDSVAHRACLDAGGTTLAVLPGALTPIYPLRHTHLAQTIIQSGGALISLTDDPASPQKFAFLARNRIVAGLADAVLITEAAQHSGTMSTAQHALDQGKPVLCVPGNITSPMSQGTNSLIKTGATPVTHINDVLYALGLKPTTTAEAFVPQSAPQTAVYEALRSGFTDLAAICQQANLPSPAVLRELSLLEIEGVAKPAGGAQWILAI